MAVRLQMPELPKLLPWLEQHFPATFKLEKELKSYLKGKFPDLDYFVDQWPHPQAVAVVVDPNGQQECTRIFGGTVVSLFGVSSEALASVLKAAYETFTDWSQPNLCRAVPRDLFPILRPLTMKEFEFYLETALVLRATPCDLIPMPVPDGMKISPATDGTVDIVDSTWEHANAHSSSYIRHLIRHFPSVVMTTASGEHVGHMFGTNYGTLGLLYVMPRFRGQGYAKVIITQLAQKYFSDGEDAYVVIDENNLPSLNLHLSVGFKPMTDVKLSWVYVSLAKK